MAARVGRGVVWKTPYTASANTANYDADREDKTIRSSADSAYLGAHFSVDKAALIVSNAPLGGIRL